MGLMALDDATQTRPNYRLVGVDRVNLKYENFILAAGQKEKQFPAALLTTSSRTSAGLVDSWSLYESLAGWTYPQKAARRVNTVTVSHYTPTPTSEGKSRSPLYEWRAAKSRTNCVRGQYKKYSFNSSANALVIGHCWPSTNTQTPRLEPSSVSQLLSTFLLQTWPFSRSSRAIDRV